MFAKFYKTFAFSFFAKISSDLNSFASCSSILSRSDLLLEMICTRKVLINKALNGAPTLNLQPSVNDKRN